MKSLFLYINKWDYKVWARVEITNRNLMKILKIWLCKTSFIVTIFNILCNYIKEAVTFHFEVL